MKMLTISFLLLISTTSIGQSHKHDHTENKATSALENSDLKILKIILKKNDELFNALLKNNQEQVAGAANILVTILKKANAIELRSIKQGSSNLSLINKTNTKEQNLKAYEGFIPSLVELVKKYQPDSNFQIYYCPMVKKNWIQDQRTNSTVKNVFAQDMLECGSKET